MLINLFTGKQKFRAVLTVVMVTGLLVLAGCGSGEQPAEEQTSDTTVISTGKETWSPSPDPLPDPAGMVRIRTRTKLRIGADTAPTLRGDYEFVRFEGGEVLMEGIYNQNGDTGEITMEWDPPRYRFTRNGTLTAGGTGNPFTGEGRLLPGFETFTLPYLLSMNPLAVDPVEVQKKDGRWRGPRGSMVLDDGRITEVQGIPQLLHERYGVYGAPIKFREDIISSRKITAEQAPEVPTVNPESLKPLSGKVGTKVPDHEFMDRTGSPISLSELEGPYVVNFWATWCGPCRAEIPELNEVFEQFEGRISVVGISSEPRGKIEQFEQNIPIRYHSWRRAGPMPRPFGGEKALPFSYFLDENLRIQTIVRGSRTADQFEQLINRHLLNQGTDKTE